jgi:hypothetical protein
MDDDQLESGEMCVYCGRGRKEEKEKKGSIKRQTEIRWRDPSI